MKAALHFLWISLISFQALASIENIPEETIEQYIELSGIEEMIDSMPVQIDAMINQRLLTAENPEVEKEVMLVLTDAWDPSDIKASISNHIQNNSNNREISELLEWRRSSLIMKITAAEAESSDPLFQNNLLRYIADLQVSPPTPETTQAIRRLVVSTDMVSLMVEMTVQVIKAMMSAFMTAESENGSEVTVDINKEINSMRAMLTPQLEQQAILTSYYIYRNISNDELNSYSSFYDSTLGKRELAVVSESLNVAMSLWAEKSAVAIVNNIERNNQP
ncbi:Uncharacterised protein [Zhongshania aliphaticivorans]|uniref:DUF2059 domain-containing protein n=1 Tax=Zhongshania aliphaticivorans TaxID=1470434 RepID=A0A5S9MR25_9GAMM|nr:hypothetical protein [Zhongshania aliphaticivorans]CAA0078978.1 Uncharacterised protein [Zhongshania aliphaticivorans]CAA0086424.1 Uncharacterised protein [Zhongshania aliphaticivorans]